MAISINKYGGSDIPEDERLVCAFSSSHPLPPLFIFLSSSFPLNPFHIFLNEIYSYISFMHQAECSALLKGYILELLRIDVAETNPASFFLLPSAPPDSRRAALEAYIDELTNTDRFNCEETFALAGA